MMQSCKEYKILNLKGPQFWYELFSRIEKKHITFRLFFFNFHELQYIFRVVARNIEPLDFAFWQFIRIDISLA